MAIVNTDGKSSEQIDTLAKGCKQRAQTLLIHYISATFGQHYRWDDDSRAEVDDIVEMIDEMIQYRIAERIQKGVEDEVRGNSSCNISISEYWEESVNG